MALYMVYTGERGGQFSVNSKAQPGLKYLVMRDVPFKIDEDDIWISSMHGMELLSAVAFAPTTVRLWAGDRTYCTAAEGAFLEGLAANCPDPARVVEIGTGKGTSLARIMYGLALHEDVRVWSIDLEEKGEAREYMEYSQIPNWRYEMLVGDSAKWGQKPWEPLDLVFVDGSHSYEGALADAVAWGPHVKEGGVLAFHDYGNPLHSVTEAVTEAMTEGWQHIGLVGTLIAYVRLP
jgi:protein-L-isoaspartate O-methyltransferase